MGCAWPGSKTAMLPRRPSLAIMRGLMGLALPKCHEKKKEKGREPGERIMLDREAHASWASLFDEFVRRSVFQAHGDSTGHWKIHFPTSLEGPVIFSPGPRTTRRPRYMPSQGLGSGRAYQRAGTGCLHPHVTCSPGAATNTTRAPHVTLRQHAPWRVSINKDAGPFRLPLDSRHPPPSRNFNLYFPNR